MKKEMLLLIISLLFISCNRQNPDEQKKHLEGYWEIHQVVFPGDSIRSYRFNETVDYFRIEGDEGFRKKMRPQLDGSYQITNDAEQIELKVEEEELYLYHTTPFTTWKEKVITAEEDELKLENEQGIIYHYKRFTPLLNKYYETE